MVLVGVRIDSRDHAASEIRHPSTHRPFGSGAAGRDRADTTVTRHLQRTGSYQVTTAPDRPPTTAGNGRPPEPTRPFNDTPRSVRKQVRSRRAPVRRSSLFTNSVGLFDSLDLQPDRMNGPRRWASCRVSCGLPPARLRSALLLMPALLARKLSPLPVVSPAPL